MKNIKLLILLLVMSFGALNTLNAQDDFTCQEECSDSWRDTIDRYYNQYYMCAAQCRWDNPYYDSGWSYSNCEESCDMNLMWYVEIAYQSYDYCIDYCD